MASLLQIQARGEDDDHECSYDDIANDGVIVAGEVQANDAVDYTNGDHGGAEVAVEFAEEGGLLIAFVQGVVDDAGGELGDNAEEDDEADGLVGGVEVGVLNEGE